MRPGLLVSVAVLGCGGSDRSGPVADAGPTDGGFEPAPPDPPALPAFTPCPAGWREVPDEDLPELVTCDPWPAAGPRACAIDEAHFPGAAGCARIGPPCPAGAFADDIPEDSTVLHVDPTAPAGGDGSRAAPYATLLAAVGAAPDDAVLALARGTFTEQVTLRRPATIWGACVAGTLLAPSGTSDVDPVVQITGRAGATLRNLRIESDRPGIGVEGTVPAVIESVVVSRARGAAVFAVDTDVVARDLVVREVTLDGDSIADGLEVYEGATVEVWRAVIERAARGGILVDGKGAAATASECAILDAGVEEPGDAPTGFGAIVQRGARLELARSVVERSADFGVFVVGPAAILVAEDVVIRDGLAEDTSGIGILLSMEGRAEISRVAIDRNGYGGIDLHGRGTTLWGEDLVVRDTREGGEFRNGGEGLVVGDAYGRTDGGGTAELRRAVFARNRTAGLVAFYGAAELVVEDLRVWGTRSQPADGLFGMGIQVSDGAELRLVRASLSDNLQTALLAASPGTVATLEHVAVTGTGAQECVTTTCPEQGGGRGLAAIDAAAMTVTHFRSSGAALCGVQVANGATIDLHDGVVEGNPVGANVQTESFDLARLQDRVLFRDNGRDLDATVLPLPGRLGDDAIRP